MDLIIKPTQACNFKCDFCSSNKIDSGGNTLSLESVFALLTKYDINTIIVNGGDPLMMPPDYYEQILTFIERQNKKTTLSLTTNLWDFYVNPDKWTALFNHPLVGIATSFQYGTERKLRNGTVFTEDLFRKVISLFKKRIGYTPMFISVLTKNNENYVIKTVELAKELNTTCKINPAVKSGRTSECYPLWKAYEAYLKIIEAGLAEYEFNANIIKDVLSGNRIVCPFSRNCWKMIRAIGPNGIMHSCGSFNDDYLTNLELGKKTYALHEYDEKELLLDHKALKNECFSCDLFMLCNGCFKQMHDIIEDNQVEEHCKHMKNMLVQFQNL